MRRQRAAGVRRPMEWFSLDNALNDDGDLIPENTLKPYMLLDPSVESVDERADATVTRIRGNLQVTLIGSDGFDVLAVGYSMGIIVGPNPPDYDTATPYANPPDPALNSEFDWLWYRASIVRNSTYSFSTWNGSSVQNIIGVASHSPMSSHDLEIDSRAQRKLRKGDNLYLIVSVGESAVGDVSGVAVGGRLRVLLKGA